MDYITGLVALYTETASNRDIALHGEDKVKTKSQVELLTTLKDFASIAKTGKLSNLFLTSFAEVVVMKEALMGFHNPD